MTKRKNNSLQNTTQNVEQHKNQGWTQVLRKGKEFLHWKYFFNFIQQCTEVGTSVNQPIVYSSTKYDTSDFEKNCSVVSCLWWFFTVIHI
jgi:hypothetical protein